MIKTNELVKVFRTDEVETTALNKVSLNIESGEFVAIMGPSGCGKSTLLNILGLLDNPSAGELWFNGNEVSKFTEKQRTNLRKANIGFVFQSFNLIDELTVYENVELPLLYLNMPSSERKKKVEAVLDRMKMSHRKKHFPQQFYFLNLTLKVLQLLWLLTLHLMPKKHIVLCNYSMDML